MVKKIELPVTPGGNEPADYDPETLELLNRQVEQEQRAARLARGEPSQRDLDGMESLLALFKEYTARTGNQLCPRDANKRDEITQALRLAERL